MFYPEYSQLNLICEAVWPGDANTVSYGFDELMLSRGVCYYYALEHSLGRDNAAIREAILDLVGSNMRELWENLWQSANCTKFEYLRYELEFQRYVSSYISVCSVMCFLLVKPDICFL